MEFLQLSRVEEGRRIKILTKSTHPQAYPYSVQAVKRYRYNGLICDNIIRSFATLEEAQAFFATVFDMLTTAERIEKAEGILRRIRSKIRAYEDAHDDIAPKHLLRAARKIRGWLDRNIPREVVEQKKRV